MIRGSLFVSIGITVYAVVGCGEGDGNGRGSSAGTSTGEISLTTGSSSGSDTTANGDGGIDGCSDSPIPGCTGLTYEGENVPLDIYVMFDLSCSMSCTVDQSGCCRGSNDEAPEDEWRIQPVREAMRIFLEDPQSAGIGVGLGFFGDHDVNNNTDESVCNVQAHSDAEVPVQVLPDAAPQLISALEGGLPQGGTPTHLAIDGACVYSNEWKQDNPSHKVVILLVTDGIPEHSCSANIQRAVSAAEDCYDDGAGREVYVLGVVANNNNSLDQLNDIADAGGTDRAYLTDADDVAGSVLTALNAIRADAAIPCTMNVPEPTSGMVDYGKVNIGICDPNEETVHTFFVEDPDDCAFGAWYYDDVGDEPVVQLCDATCESVAAAGTKLTLSVGCATVTDPIR